MTRKLPELADLGQLSGLAPALASTVVHVAGDVALVIGADGVISSAAAGALPVDAGSDGWVGRAWADTATSDSRCKVDRLLQEARNGGVSRRREINHPVAGGTSIPLSWAAVQLGEHGPVLAVGRDLRAVAAIQQRFIDAQNELERDYWQRRQAETRYRQLFQVASDAVVVLDAADMTVIEANPTAHRLFGNGDKTMADGALRDRFDAASRPAADELLANARASGVAAEVRLRLAGRGLPGAAVDVSATPFRSADRHCLLVRARSVEATASFFEQTSDAAVITDSSGRVRMANAAFNKLCAAPGEGLLRGRPLGALLGDAQGRWAALLARVRAAGLVGRAVMPLQVNGAAPLLAEVSGALLADSEQEDIGFTLRLLADSNDPQFGAPAPLARTLAELAAALGEQPLPVLLQQAAELTERHLLQTALARCGGSVDAAAALLHLTADALQQRIQAHGLARLN